VRESHQLVPIWALKQERERSEEHQHCGSTANRTCAKGDLVSVLDRGEVVPELVSGAVALLLNRGFCGWQAVFYHLNRGQYAILPLNRGQTFCHRKEVVLSIAVVFKIVGKPAFLRSDRRPRQSSYVRLVSAARLTC